MSDIPDFSTVLEILFEKQEDEIDLVQCALALAYSQLPERSMERYWRHIQKLITEVEARHQKLLKAGSDDDVRTQLAALKHVIADKHGYDGDREHYDNLQNANLVHVIDRRLGMPITLSILYIYVGGKQGWNLGALSFPAHVVCTIEKNGEKLLFDPFNQCTLLNAADLRQYLKTLIGPKAELSAEYYQSVTKRDLLTRLQNNIKLRQIEAEDYENAVQTVEMMRKIKPTEYQLLFDAGVLYARIDKPLAALRAFENYIELTTDPKGKEEAYAIMQQVKSLLN